MHRHDFIKHVAGILFGRDPATGEPEFGWVSKLARAMRLSEGAVRATLRRSHSPVFDRKLIMLMTERREAMIKQLAELDELERRLSEARATVPLKIEVTE